jgi:hypothetical protein
MVHRRRGDWGASKTRWLRPFAQKARPAKPSGTQKDALRMTTRVNPSSFRCSNWNPFENFEKRKISAIHAFSLKHNKLPKLPLVNPKALSWRHLVETKTLVNGK